MSRELVITEVRKQFSSPLVRHLLKLGSYIRCPIDGKSIIEANLDGFSGQQQDPICKAFYGLSSHFYKGKLKKASSTFGADEKSLIKTLKDGFAYTLRRGICNVLESIGMYGVTKPQRLSAPFLVVWDFTRACNLYCKHCYARAGRPSSDELTTQESKDLIDELYDDGVVMLAFSGGEPLMRRDFFEVARYAKEKGFYTAVASNGTLITPQVAEKLKSCVDYVEISLDGTEKTHDSFRGVAGAFKKTISGIKNCVSAGLYTCLATTVTRRNYDEVKDVYSIVCDLHVNRFMHFNFVPTGRGKDVAKDDLSPDQRENLLKLLLDEGHSRIDALSTAPQFARVAVERERGIPVGHFYSGKGIEGSGAALADFIGGCGAGRMYCSIEPNGDVQPCVFMPIKVGNVREKPFLDIWRNSPVLNDLRDRSNLKGHCGECDFKYICGGCRARAYGYFDDYLAPDPGCKHNLKYWNKLQSLNS